MHDATNPKAGNDIDLREIFSTLWSHKSFIILTCALGIFLGINYALTAKKKYVASANFTLNFNNNNSNILSSLPNALSRYAGMANFNDPNDKISDEIMGREFIVVLNKELMFEKDKFFFNNDPKYKGPAWKLMIKNIIGWQDSAPDPNEKMWQSITNTYKNNVSVAFSKTGSSIIISVTHTNAKRAAKIANTIMKTLIKNINVRSKLNRDNQLNYLSQTLAGALSDLEEAQSELKNFTLENSSTPLESFVLKNQALNIERVKLERTNEIHTALKKISSLLDSGSVNPSNYMLLRKEFPVVDLVEFRRVLGQNEIISTWNWPEKSLVAAVLDTLSERKKRLEIKVLNSQIEAEKAAEVLEKYTALNRTLKISEATHAVLIEQVKTQNFISGHTPDNSKVFEYAAPSLQAVSPKRPLVLAIGTILGFFLGCGIVLVFAMYRKVYYTHKSIINSAKAELNIKSLSIASLRSKSLAKINYQLQKKSYTELKDLAVLIHRNKNTHVLFTSLNSRIKGSDIAKAISGYMHSDNLKIALIELSSQPIDVISNKKLVSINTFNIVENETSTSILQPNKEHRSIEFIGRRDFKDQISSLQTDFDFIFISADDASAISLANAYFNQEVTHISSVRIKRTKSEILITLRKLLPIQGLLYE
jgi:uncharacterized protein involved in exopolysaccharide biosynthesis